MFIVPTGGAPQLRFRSWSEVGPNPKRFVGDRDWVYVDSIEAISEEQGGAAIRRHANGPTVDFAWWDDQGYLTAEGC